MAPEIRSMRTMRVKPENYKSKMDSDPGEAGNTIKCVDPVRLDPSV